LREQVDAANGLLIATPEYNASLSGALKNALDWLSRPLEDGRLLLAEKPVAMMAASMGPFGTLRAQIALRQVPQNVNAKVVAQPEVLIPRAHKVLDQGIDPESLPATLLPGLLGELDRLMRVYAVAA
jgi:chromate reductase